MPPGNFIGNFGNLQNLTQMLSYKWMNNQPLHLAGGCMVEWTNTGPYSYFMESIPLEFSPHVLKPVIQMCLISHPFVVEFQMYARSSLWAVRCGYIVRPWSLGFGGHALVPITYGPPFFSGRLMHVPALMPICRIVVTLVASAPLSCPSCRVAEGPRYIVAYVPCRLSMVTGEIVMHHE